MKKEEPVRTEGDTWIFESEEESENAKFVWFWLAKRSTEEEFNAKINKIKHHTKILRTPKKREKRIKEVNLGRNAWPIFNNILRKYFFVLYYLNGTIILAIKLRSINFY